MVRAFTPLLIASCFFAVTLGVTGVAGSQEDGHEEIQAVVIELDHLIVAINGVDASVGPWDDILLGLDCQARSEIHFGHGLSLRPDCAGPSTVTTFVILSTLPPEDNLLVEHAISELGELAAVSLDTNDSRTASTQYGFTDIASMELSTWPRWIKFGLFCAGAVLCFVMFLLLNRVRHTKLAWCAIAYFAPAAVIWLNVEAECTFGLERPGYALGGGALLLATKTLVQHRGGAAAAGTPHRAQHI